MGGFIEPNIHPIIVHFGYALIVTALVAHLLGSWKASLALGQNLKVAGDWMLAFGVFAIVATAASGLWAYYTVAHDGPSHAAMTLHRNWALPTAAAVIALGVWRFTQRIVQPGSAYLVASALVVSALSVTAWLGGDLVYGHGIGVAQLPAVSGDGHDHDHGNAGQHAHAEPAPLSDASPAQNISPADLADASPAQVADRLSQALKAGDAETLEALFLPSVIIAEGGAAERSFAEYASHHMRSDMAYIGAVTTRTVNRDVIEEGDLAFVVTESLMSGRYRDQEVRNRLMETLTLRKAEAGWRIAHVHWSSGAAPDETDAGHSHEDGGHDHDHGESANGGTD